MSLTKQSSPRNPDDFPTVQLFLLGKSPFWNAGEVMPPGQD